MKNKYYNFDEFTIEVINNPKINIDKSLIEDLVAECTILSRDSFGSQDISKNLIRRHILETSTTVVGRDSLGKVVGFGSSKIIPIKKFYIINLQCIVISNDYKRKGLQKVFFPLRIIEEIKKIKARNKFINQDNILIGCRTQNPIAYRTLNKLIGLFPDPDGFIDDRIRGTGRKFAESLHKDDCKHHHSVSPFIFDHETFIAKAAYKTDSNHESNEVDIYNSKIPFSHDPEIDDYMKNNLDWKNGDALILLGYYNSEKVKSLLKNGQQIILNHTAENPANRQVAV